MNRRAFLGTGTSCAARVLLAGAALPAWARVLFAARPAGTPVRDEPWGRIERVAEGVWALISTPLSGGEHAMRTLSNGGIVAGRSGTLLVEGFASDAGAAWLADAARELTGRGPTHVVLTHYHGDHSVGLAGYRRPNGTPVYVTTEPTRRLLAEGLARRPALVPVVELLSSAELVNAETPLTIDLGGRRVLLTPRSGHTPSDITVSVEDPRVVFCGDLVWNGMFPNYRDAIPSVLSREVRATIGPLGATYVPGHGAIASAQELDHYVAVLDHVEATARRAFAAGIPAEAAAREFALPEALGEWYRFSESYYQVALRAWERELRGAG